MYTDNKNVIYRCPVCFARDNDVVLHSGDEGDYYCVKCSFHGSKNEILQNYSNLKTKYKNITTRLTLEDICKI